MNSKEAIDRLVSGVRARLGKCGIPPESCFACTADRAALDRIDAEAQALADVRTLDEWTAAHPDESPAVPVPLPASVGVWCVFMMGGEFTGASPDEARAKAAAWAREQAKGAQAMTEQDLGLPPRGSRSTR